MPIGTAWSTGNSWESAPVMYVPVELLAAKVEGVAVSRYNATSYSNRPGDSSTIPLILAPEGLHICIE